MYSARIVVCVLLIIGAVAEAAETPAYRSHPPMRPLQLPSDRPMAAGRAKFVAPAGNDGADGAQAQPWRTLVYAVGRLEPGDTLYVRGGTYYEHVGISASGTAEKPITIRSYPGELAIIDGGLREFYENPAVAWKVCPDGAEGEYWSARTFPDLGGGAGATNVLGRFGDSMIPLHGYRFLTDLRSSNEFFSKLGATKTEQGTGIYCGPGVFYDADSGRIHVRLAHTQQSALGENNYRGETDPRKLPLVICGQAGGSPLTLRGARYLRIQDLVVRGGRDAAVAVERAVNIEFDGVTAYGGATAFRVADTLGLRLINCACRGIAAPWTFRGSLKYRAIEARLFSASGWTPSGADNGQFELAYSEFTDSVDGVFIGNVHGVSFHHNLLDNVSDDGIFLTAGTAYDGTTPGGNVRIYQNLLSRCLTTFAFGVGHGRQKTIPGGKQTGSGVFIYRNVFDFRRPVHYQQPDEAGEELSSYGRIAGDHGSPGWEPMTFYHNTVLSYDPPFRDVYAAGLGGHLPPGTRRRVLNNMITQVEGLPGRLLPPVPLLEANTPVTGKSPKAAPDPLDSLLDGDSAAARKPPSSKNNRRSGGNGLDDIGVPPDKGTNPSARARPAPLPIDFVADGNLHWSFGASATGQPGAADATRLRNAAEFLKGFQQSPQFKASQRLYPPGWTKNDVVADPQFVAFTGNGSLPADCSLQSGSPAANAGVAIPAEWPDPLREADAGKPDLGALPLGVKAWRVGLKGRLTMFGALATGAFTPEGLTGFPIPEDSVPSLTDRKPAIVIEGYPAFDSPLVQFALRRQRIPVEVRERTWLLSSDYQNYSLVAIVGDLARGKVEPRRYTAEDLTRVKRFLDAGGTLLLLRGTSDVFATPEGHVFLANLLGTPVREAAPVQPIAHPEHAWVKHLDPQKPHDWLTAKSIVPLVAGNGEVLLQVPSGQAFLYRLRIGKGQFIYIGWEIASSLPGGRTASSVEQEQAFEEQMQILLKAVGE